MQNKFSRLLENATSITKPLLVARNVLWLTLGKVFTGLLAIILTAIVARKLGVNQFGIFALSLSIAGILSYVADFGSSYLTTREIAMDNEQVGKYLISGSIVKIFLIVPIYITLFLSLKHFYAYQIRFAIYLAFSAIIFLTFIKFFTSIFNGLEKMHYTAIILSAYSLLLFIISLIIIFLGYRHATNLLYGNIIASIIMTIATLIVLKKTTLHSGMINFDSSFCYVFFKKSIPFGLFFIGGIIYFQADTVMLSIMKTMDDVGFYQASMKLITEIDIIPFIFTSALYPTITKEFVSSKIKAGIMMEQAFRYMLYLGLPLALGVTLLSQHIISLIFGNKYQATVLIFQILAWIIPIRFCAHVLGTILSASGNQSFRALSTWISALVNICLNLILIPRYSYNGAAIASVVTAAILLSLYYYATSKKFFRIRLLKIIKAPLVSCIIMGIILFKLNEININFFVLVIIGIIIYFVFLILAKGINRNDYKIIKNILSIKRERTPRSN